MRGIWDKNTAYVFDIRVTDTDQPAYFGPNPEQVVTAQEKTNKNLHQERCFENRRRFVPYVFFVSDFLGKEAKAYNKRIATLLTKKWQSLYSVTCGYINARMSVAILQVSHLYIRRSQVPFGHVASKLLQ